MPPKAKVTKEDIVLAAVELVREEGASALNARAVASRLGVSTQPIFSNYSTMDELREAVLGRADSVYRGFIAREIGEGRYPAYKASGMAYIRFAKEERELFKLLFMRDRTGENTAEDDSAEPIIEMIRQNTGLDRKKASLLHIEMWIYVHGIATMAATSFLEWEESRVSEVLTDAYMGLRARHCGRE